MRPLTGSCAAGPYPALEGLEPSGALCSSSKKLAALPSPPLCPHLLVTPALALALVHLLLAFPSVVPQAAVTARPQDYGSWKWELAASGHPDTQRTGPSSPTLGEDKGAPVPNMPGEGCGAGEGKKIRPL